MEEKVYSDRDVKRRFGNKITFLTFTRSAIIKHTLRLCILYFQLEFMNYIKQLFNRAASQNIKAVNVLESKPSFYHLGLNSFLTHTHAALFAWVKSSFLQKSQS